MRIAVSGVHYCGKTTLIESLLEHLPGYASVDEPYYLLEEEGYEFAHPPTVEDFEEQIKRSVAVIKESGDNTIFDRSPLDYLADALVAAKESPFDECVDVENLLQMMNDAIALLDLIVYIPIESRILVPNCQDLKFRRNVEATLQEMLLEDSLEILDDIEVLEVTGSLEKRVKMVRSFL